MLDLANVQAPTEKVSGLPSACYINSAMYEHDQNTLFRNSWVAVGFGKDILQPGCAKPENFAGLPMLLVRNQVGRVNVFQNVCRHSGMILFDTAKRLRVRSVAPIMRGLVILTGPCAKLRMMAALISMNMDRSNIATTR